ncbi:MAG: hypothetical protein WDM92_08180 [Caulobacteraceae bacterium]
MDASLRAFAAGFDGARAGAAPRLDRERPAQAAPEAATAAGRALLAEILDRFPAALHEILWEGVKRPRRLPGPRLRRDLSAPAGGDPPGRRRRRRFPPDRDRRPLPGPVDVLRGRHRVADLKDPRQPRGAPCARGPRQAGPAA